MDENKITLNDYVEKKLSAEIAELKVQLAKTVYVSCFAGRERAVKSTVGRKREKIRKG